MSILFLRSTIRRLIAYPSKTFMQKKKKKRKKGKSLEKFSKEFHPRNSTVSFNRPLSTALRLQPRHLFSRNIFSAPRVPPGTPFFAFEELRATNSLRSSIKHKGKKRNGERKEKEIGRRMGEEERKATRRRDGSLSLSLSTSPMRGESARKRYRVPLQAGFGSTRPRERTPLPARPAGERFHIFFLQTRRAVSFGSAARGSSVYAF